MASTTFPHPHLFRPHLLTSQTPFQSQTLSLTKLTVRPTLRKRIPPRASLSDPFVLQIAETLEDSTSSLPSSSTPPRSLQKLRDTSSESLLSMSWPSLKDEPFRFTDTSFIKNSQILPISIPPSSPFDHLTSIEDTHFPSLVIVDGHVDTSLSNLGELPNGVYVGSISNLPSDEMRERVLEFVSDFPDGDIFWSLNGVGAPDVTVVFVPSGCRFETPLHLRFLSLENSEFGSKRLPVSNPRVLVLVEKGGELGIIEEYFGGTDDKCYWANSVMEMLIEQGGRVTHSYIQKQSSYAAHTKWTFVRQEASSTYKLVEINTGGKLSRHNLHVQQVGSDTDTELSTLHLCVGDQTQDLHSRLVLDHPRGTSQQLHKCIVANSSGQAVFDGNVRVNRFAQQTNAAQLTRSLLLEPRATVNIKPNLQIIADDVKCSHGAAISDLEADDQFFYFRARGIDSNTAKRALVFSFGAEVLAQLPYESLRKTVTNHVKGVLESKV